MTLPGTSVAVIPNAPSPSNPTATAPWFVAGITQQGPTTPVACGSLAAFVAAFGGRISNSVLYDSIDAYFNEGGSLVNVARVVGPSPVYATVNLPDGSAVTSLIVSAKTYGTYANGWKIIVTGSGPYTITVEDASSNVLEVSPSLTTQADAVAYGVTSAYVNVTLGTSTNIPTAETNKVLASGTDDYTNATDTQYLAAINQFPLSMGPGQVSMPGRTTATAHANLIAHAAANNRRDILDYADVGAASTLITAAGIDSAVSGSMYAAAFSPWVQIPGVVTGVARTVPPSAIVAGIIARNDGNGVSQNQPSAGPVYGASQYAIGLSQAAWSDTDRSNLNNAGVNVIIKTINGIVIVFGYRTLAPVTVPADWALFSNSRLVMEIAAAGRKILDGYVFAEIDAKGHTLADVTGDLNGMLAPYIASGDVSSTSVQVTTTSTPLQLVASIGVTLSPYAEELVLQITTETVGV